MEPLSPSIDAPHTTSGVSYERPGLDGNDARRGLASHRLGRIPLHARPTHRHLALNGLRVAITPKAGTRLVRARSYRGKRRCRLELTPGTRRARLGPTASRTFEVFARG
jgi:hypothetical protein